MVGDNNKCINGECLSTCKQHYDCQRYEMVCNLKTQLCAMPECRSYDDCEGSMTCFDFKCVSNHACEDNKGCWKRQTKTALYSDGTKFTSFTCKENICETDCSSHDACSLGYSCVNSICRKRDCIENKDCDTRQCEDGQCKQIECSNSRPCPPSLYCTADHTCHILPGCGNGSICPANLTCSGDMCVKKDLECEAFSDCDYGYGCENKMCIRYMCSKQCLNCFKGLCYDYCYGKNKQFCPGEIILNKECEAGEAAYFGKCVKISCQKNFHCPGALKCKKKKCVKNICWANKQCKDGFICKNDECVPRSKCQFHHDCDEKEFCRMMGSHKLCVDNPGSLCTSNKDCGATEVCDCLVNGKCYCSHQVIDRLCLHDIECGLNYGCNLKTGVCQHKPSCLENNCPTGYTCDKVNKRCIQLYTYCPDGYRLDEELSMCLLRTGGNDKLCKYTPYISSATDEICQPVECGFNKKCKAGYVCSSQKRCHKEEVPCDQCSYCNSDFDCEHGWDCRLGQCFKRCTQNGCDQKEVCQNGYCTRDSKTCPKGFQMMNELCIKERECLHDGHCIDGTKCDKKRCVSVTYKDLCLVDSDCKEISYCLNGNCICLNTRCFKKCINGITCPTPDKCTTVRESAICVPQIPHSHTCPFKGMMVVNGKCVFSNCFSSKDCKGKVCFQGNCEDTKKRCASAKCPPNNVCKNGICVLKKDICLTDEDCKAYSHAYCDSGICTKKIYGGCPHGMQLGVNGFCRKIICRTDEHCKHGFKCTSTELNYGFCMEVDPEGPPEDYSICLHGQHKTNGICENIQCYDDGDCDFSTTCIYGICQTRKPDCSSKG